MLIDSLQRDEELIDACGENFGSLDKRHDGWLARANGDQHCFAGTPAEDRRPLMAHTSKAMIAMKAQT